MAMSWPMRRRLVNRKYSDLKAEANRDAGGGLLGGHRR